jgi:UDP-N-acetylmuramate dehydrogenase
MRFGAALALGRKFRLTASGSPPFRGLVVDEAKKMIKKQQVALAPLSSFRLGGQAQLMWQVTSAEQLRQAVDEARKLRVEPVVVGAMTNIVWLGQTVPAVIQLLPSGQPLPQVDGDGRWRVWAGEMMARVAVAATEQGWGGLESFAGLPGTVGGAVWNNAHFGTDLLSQYWVAVRVVDLVSGKIEEKAAAELDLGYDRSWFQGQRVAAMEAILALPKSPQPNRGRELIQAAREKRRTSQPIGQYSVGCFWRNPENSARLRQLWPQWRGQERISAGFVIEQAGLKGRAVGGVKVSEKHAAFMINDGTATSADVIKLARLIQREVEAKFAIRLQPEVKCYPLWEQNETELAGGA